MLRDSNQPQSADPDVPSSVTPDSDPQIRQLWRLFAIVFFPLFAVYLATATWTLPYHEDAMTNAVTSWYLGNRGTPVVAEHAHLADPLYRGSLGWFVDGRLGPVAQYPPGAALIAAPIQAVIRQPLVVVEVVGSNTPELDPVDFPLPPLWPATLAASVATAAAMAFLALGFAEFGTRKQAALAAYVAGLGTGAWSVASDQLWQHGPAMLWLAASIWFAAREKYWLSGLGFAFAVVTRPHTALVAAGVGLWTSFTTRTWAPVVRIGVVSGAGLGALLAFNRYLFAQTSVSGGYGSGFTETLVSADAWWFLRNVALGFFDLDRGLLIWSPFLLFLIPGIRRGWRGAPGWLKGSAVGGLVYLLVQLRANRFSGGAGHFAYRYPLEMLVATAPLWFRSWVTWVRQSPLARPVAAAAVVSIAVHGVGSLL